MTNETSNLYLKARYRNVDLEVLLRAHNDSQWWHENPIVLTPDEQKAIDFEETWQLLSGKDLSPSNCVELTEEQCSDPLIASIEALFRRAMQLYQNLFDKAWVEDEKILTPKNTLLRKKIEQQSNYTLRSTFFGGLFFGIGAIPGFLIGMSYDNEQTANNNREKMLIQREGSANRRAALLEIHAHERIRRHQIQETLQKNAIILKQKLQQQINASIYDETLDRRYLLYEKVYRHFFPLESFCMNEEISPSINYAPPRMPVAFKLQRLIDQKFASSPCTEARQCMSFLTQIYGHVRREDLVTVERVCFSVLSNNDYLKIKEFLENILAICEKGYAKQLFQYLTTKKYIFHNEQTLQKIIGHFRELSLMQSDEKATSPFPPYDEKGFEYLRGLLDPSKAVTQWSFPPLISKTRSTTLNNFFAAEQRPYLVPRENVDALLKRFTGQDPQVYFPLEENRQREMARQYDKVMRWQKTWSDLDIYDLAQKAYAIVQERDCVEHIEKLCAIGVLAIRQEFLKAMYPVQILTVLGKLLHCEGCVAQVKTGEGKSLVTTLLAFILAVQGHRIHIISSSSNLSKRDQSQFKGFFEKFGMVTGQICASSPVKEQFDPQILYGTAHHFEFAVMREITGNITLFPQAKEVPGKKRFSYAIVDEVDMNIDTALNHARISYPAKDAYDWIYEPIFTYVKNTTAEFFDQCNLAIHLPQLKRHLQQKLGDMYHNQLSKISDEQLGNWMDAAHQAIFEHKEKTHYVLTKDSETGNNAITIVDYKHTGRLMPGTRWTNGVHEFLEVKHGMKPYKEGVTPLVISHASFYPYYRGIYGLSGTLGSKTERQEIQETYGIPCFDIPTHQPFQREDWPTTIVETEQEIWQLLLQRNLSMHRQKRPILNLALSISDSEELAQTITRSHLKCQIINETQQETEERVLALAGDPGSITIATNTAGRGTDIILQPESLEAGGLHVVMMFFPDSERVEYQGRGRAGRQGQKGSSEIILCRERLKQQYPGIEALSNNEILEYLKQVREIKASNSKHLRIALAKLERHRFSLSHQYYAKLDHFRCGLKNDLLLDEIAEHLQHLRSLQPLENIACATNPTLQNTLDTLRDYIYQGAPLQNYKMLLSNIIESLIDQSVQDWSQLFNCEVDTLLKEFSENMNTQRSVLALLLEYFQKKQGFEKSYVLQFEEQIAQIQNSLVQEFQEKMDAIFTSSKTQWGKYIEPSGRGVMQYLRELSKLPLPMEAI